MRRSCWGCWCERSGSGKAGRQRGELAGILGGAAARSVAWECGANERANGVAFWGFCSARALARRGQQPLQRARHRDGEVAAGGLLWAAWQGEEAPARAKEGGGKQQGDAWNPARRRTRAGGLSTAPATLHSGGGREKQRKGAGGGRKDRFAISENSRDQTVKQG